MTVVVGVKVFVGVIVNVGVIEGVGVGVESIQSKQKGFKKLYFVLSILALCCTSGIVRGFAYIENDDIPPSKVPAKFCSIRMFVVKVLRLVPLKIFGGNNSGSCM